MGFLVTVILRFLPFFPVQVEQLKQLCRARKLRVSGKKAELVERILESERSTIEQSEVASELQIDSSTSVARSLTQLMSSSSVRPDASASMHIEALRRAIEHVYKSETHTTYRSLPRNQRGLQVTVLGSTSSSIGHADTLVQDSDDVSVASEPDRDVQLLVLTLDPHSGEVINTVDDTEELWARARKPGSDIMAAISRRYQAELDYVVQRERSKSLIPSVGAMVYGRIASVNPNGLATIELEDSGTRAKLSTAEQLPDEELAEGQRIALSILSKGVEGTDELPSNEEDILVNVSRATADLVAGAMQHEMPCVASGEVEIQHIARIPGELTKVAVARSSETQREFDVVRECLGEGSSNLRRLREIIGGERVGIIRWESDDLAERVKASLQPAKCETVTLRKEGHTQIACVQVPNEREKGRALGRSGNNIRLASELTGVQLELAVQSSSNVLELVGDDRTTKPDKETIDEMLGLSEAANTEEDSSSTASSFSPSESPVSSGPSAAHIKTSGMQQVEDVLSHLGAYTSGNPGDDEGDKFDELIERISGRIHSDDNGSSSNLEEVDGMLSSVEHEELIADPLDTEPYSDDEADLESLLEGLEAPENAVEAPDAGLEG